MFANVINFLDLFSGIGGFHKALIDAGLKIGYSAFSEIDKHASCVYKKHFNNSKDLGDVRAIKPIRGKINNQKIHLITFGFPCQDLSIAGKGKGLEGDRSSLFFEAIRLIKELKPRYFIFENVKGLFSSNNGKDFIQILKTISDIGYVGGWQLINSAWLLPQNRERIYFVGHPRGKSRKQIFPLFKTEKTYAPRQGDEIQQINTNTLKSRDYASWRGNFLTQLNKAKSQGLRVYNTDCSCTIASQAGGLGAKTGLYAVNSDIRRLTPIECERLQGFPDGWTKGHSDNQRYKMLGNAVSVPVVKEIISKIYL